MEKQTYNGWTNYATWRVNLEWFDGAGYQDTWQGFANAYELGKALREYVEETVSEVGGNTFATDYAMAFLSDVDWHQIATHVMADMAEDEVQSC